MISTWTPTVSNIMAFWATCFKFGAVLHTVGVQVYASNVLGPNFGTTSIYWEPQGRMGLELC